MKRSKFILYIAVSMAVSSAVTHCVDTYYVYTHSKPTNAKDTEPCTINITTENATFHDSDYVDVIDTSEFDEKISFDKKD